MKTFLILSLFLTLFSCSNLSKSPERLPSSYEKTHLVQGNCFVSIQNYLSTEGIFWDVLRQQPNTKQFLLEIDEPSFYDGHKNVLRLGDGKNGYEDSRKLAEQYPNQTFLSSDVRFNDMEVDPEFSNLLKLNIDSTKEFPIPSNSQDLIIMKRGLCACHSTCHTCGGLDLTNRSQVIGFFMQVIRVLRTSNPNARAILQGGVFKDYPYAFYVFIDVIKHFKNHPDVEFVYLKRAVRDDDRFFGIMIRPRNWQQ